MTTKHAVEILTGNVSDDKIWAQWHPVFDFVDNFTSTQGGTLENALKNYQHPNGSFPKKQVVKTAYDKQNNYFVDEYNDKVKMLWKVTTPDGIYYFSRRDVICPSGDVLMFD